MHTCKHLHAHKEVLTVSACKGRDICEFPHRGFLYKSVHHTKYRICIYIYIYTDFWIFACIQRGLKCELSRGHRHMWVCTRWVCIQARTHKNIATLSNMNPCCADPHMFVPARVLTLRTSLYTCIDSQVYICQLHGHDVHCQLHLWHSRVRRDFSPVRREHFGLRMKRVRTLLSGGRIHRCFVTCIISQVLFLHEPVMRKLTYVCALASAHT